MQRKFLVSTLQVDAVCRHVDTVYGQVDTVCGQCPHFNQVLQLILAPKHNFSF